jgi:hypothetical protein
VVIDLTNSASFEDSAVLELDITYDQHPDHQFRITAASSICLNGASAPTA